MREGHAPVQAHPAFSNTDPEIVLLEMYLLHVTGAQVFSTQRRVIFSNPLHVTNDHSSSNLASNSRALHM